MMTKLVLVMMMLLFKMQMVMMFLILFLLVMLLLQYSTICYMDDNWFNFYMGLYCCWWVWWNNVDKIVDDGTVSGDDDALVEYVRGDFFHVDRFSYVQ